MVGIYSSIDIDSHDTLFVSYFSNGQLKIAESSGDEWHITSLSMATGDPNYIYNDIFVATSLRVGPLDEPKVVYTDGLLIKYIDHFNGEWNKNPETIAQGKNRTVAIDSQNRPHDIAFYDMANNQIVYYPSHKLLECLRRRK